MNWPAHVFFGLVAGGVAAYFFNFDYLLVVFSVLGALAPDIDHDSSKIRKIIDFSFPILAFFMTYSYLKNINEMLFIYTLALIGIYHIIITYLKPRHRGIMHTFIFALVVSIIIYFMFSLTAGILFFIGYASHLVADLKLKVL
ncbi:MAG: metal-dependent hydrolase [Candidatus Anstonellales archaeon]